MRTVLRAVFWVVSVTTVGVGIFLLALEHLVPAVGVLLGGAPIALVLAALAYREERVGRIAERAQRRRNATAILIAGAVMAGAGAVLALAAPGSLSNVLLMSGIGMVLGGITVRAASPQATSDS